MNWDEAIKNLEQRREKALQGGGQAKIDKQHKPYKYSIDLDVVSKLE